MRSATLLAWAPVPGVGPGCGGVGATVPFADIAMLLVLSLPPWFQTLIETLSATGGLGGK
jgi:hypothetical protein